MMLLCSILTVWLSVTVSLKRSQKTQISKAPVREGGGLRFASKHPFILHHRYSFIPRSALMHAATHPLTHSQKATKAPAQGPAFRSYIWGRDGGFFLRGL